MKKKVVLVMVCLLMLVLLVQAGCKGKEAPVVTIEYWEGTYTGQLKDGIPHGKGTLVWPDGRGKYEGEWFEGNWHGEGTYTHADGTVESGRWEYCQFMGEE